MTRVCVIGPAKTGDMCWFIKRAFERQGVQVVVVDDRHFLSRVRGKVGNALQVAQTRMQRGPVFARLQSLVKEAARGSDLILTVKGENLLPETVESLSKIAPTVNWYSDHPFLEQNFASISAYTIFCPKDHWTSVRLTNMGFSNVVCLPHAGDPLSMSSTERPVVDISMLGSMYPYRARHVEALLGEGFTMHLQGGRLPNVGWPLTQDRRPAVGSDYADAMARSHLVLNTHTPFDVAGANQRLFDAAAAGRPQLSEDLCDSRLHFDSTEVAFFAGRDQLLQFATELLADPEAQRKMGRAALARVLDAHTYEHRFRTLWGLLS